MEETMASLEERIRDGSARVAVIGLGYGGFPLAQRAREAGFDVVGIDRYLSDERLSDIEAIGIRIDTAFEPVRDCDIVLICVPTPLADGQQPNISFIVEAAEDVARNFGAGEVLVVLESTS